MAGFVSQATLEQIRAANDIVDVIGSCLPLKRAGGNFVALCPFHREKSPSFNVHPQKQIFHCFGCHKGGDVFTFIREYESVDFPEAVRRLAERARIPLDFEQAPGAQLSRTLKEKLLQIHEQIAQRWHNALLNEASGQIARDYLAKRGVSEDAVKLFRLGYAPDLWDDTVNWARGKGYPLEDMEKSGLILRRESGDGHYDRFRGRLMFPICDEQGRVIGFSGRILTGDEKTAKYVNSPETPIFYKSKVFFGLDKSKRAILEAGHAIICEGQLDLIACYMAGVQNMVAPQGTAFTPEHARILKRYVEEVILCFDSDSAGQNAAVRALDSLLGAGLAVRVAVIPSPHDPDSFIRDFGGEAFKQLMSGAEGFFDFYLNRLCATHAVDTDRGRMAILNAMSEAVHKTGNAVLIDRYSQKTALRLGVSPESVRSEFAKKGGKAVVRESPEEELMESPVVEPPSPQEYWLLKILLLNEEMAGWALLHLDAAWIRHAKAREVVSRLLETHRQGAWSSLGAFLDQCEEPALQSLVTEVAAQDRPIPNPEQQVGDIALRLRNLHLDREIATVRQRLNQPELTDEVRLDLLRRQEELRKLKAQPLA